MARYRPRVPTGAISLAVSTELHGVLQANGVVAALAAPFRHAIVVTPLGDYPGDSCQRPRPTRDDEQRAYPQLEPPIEMLRCWSAGSMTSLTRKRPLVQSQYRPPSFTRSAARSWRPVIAGRQGCWPLLSVIPRPADRTSGLVRRHDLGLQGRRATSGASPQRKRSLAQFQFRQIYRAECSNCRTSGGWAGDYRPL